MPATATAPQPSCPDPAPTQTPAQAAAKLPGLCLQICAMGNVLVHTTAPTPVRKPRSPALYHPDPRTLLKVLLGLVGDAMDSAHITGRADLMKALMRLGALLLDITSCRSWESSVLVSRLEAIHRYSPPETFRMFLLPDEYQVC